MKTPFELGYGDKGKAKFYAWANTADNMEWSLHETEETAKVWCDYYLKIERDDGYYSEEAISPMAIGYAKILQASRYDITDKQENYRFKSASDIPDNISETEQEIAEEETWPYDSDWESVGTLTLHPVGSNET